MAWEADVYQGDRLAAHIERTPKGSRFQFVTEFLADKPTFPGFLAWRLPYEDEPVEQIGDNLHPFFWNLLPEGGRLQTLLDQNRIAKDDFLGMLLTVGWDAIGDVAVLPHGRDPKTHQAAIAKKDVSEISFWRAFQETTGQNPDAAIPGVQEKLSAGTIAFPIKGLGTSSAILKLNPNRYPLLVQNEFTFLKLAKVCGIQPAKARLVHDELGEPGLWVDRFDRVRVRRSIAKLHQEDMCQITNTSPANKYKLSLRNVVEALHEVCTAPIVETQRLMSLYAFAYLTGNADMHAKNISVLWRDGSARLSPAYDLPSTLPYHGGGSKLLPHMSLRMDQKDLNFKMVDFEAFFTRFGLSQLVVRATLEKMRVKVMANLSLIDTIGFDEGTTDAVKVEIAKRCSGLSS
jgi:serine/threonine-protein kinase HipA